MKRSAVFFLTAAVALLFVLAGLAFRPNRSVPYEFFQERFLTAIKNQPLHIEEHRSGPADDVPLPLSILWHPRRWGHPKPHLILGFPDSTEYYLLEFGNSSQRIECFVRYLDARAVLISIRYPKGQEEHAQILHDTLQKAFPGLPINMSQTP